MCGSQVFHRTFCTVQMPAVNIKFVFGFALGTVLTLTVVGVLGAIKDSEHIGLVMAGLGVVGFISNIGGLGEPNHTDNTGPASRAPAGELNGTDNFAPVSASASEPLPLLDPVTALSELRQDMVNKVCITKQKKKGAIYLSLSFSITTYNVDCQRTRHSPRISPFSISNICPVRARSIPAPTGICPV